MASVWKLVAFLSVLNAVNAVEAGCPDGVACPTGGNTSSPSLLQVKTSAFISRQDPWAPLSTAAWAVENLDQMTNKTYNRGSVTDELWYGKTDQGTKVVFLEGVTDKKEGLHFLECNAATLAESLTEFFFVELTLDDDQSKELLRAVSSACVTHALAGGARVALTIPEKNLSLTAFKDALTSKNGTKILRQQLKKVLLDLREHKDGLMEKISEKIGGLGQMVGLSPEDTDGVKQVLKKLPLFDVSTYFKRKLQLRSGTKILRKLLIKVLLDLREHRDGLMEKISETMGERLGQMGGLSPEDIESVKQVLKKLPFFDVSTYFKRYYQLRSGKQMCFKRNFQLRSGKQILRKLLAPVGGLRGETYEKLLNRLALFNARKEIWETWEKFKATGNIFAFVRNMLPPLTEVSAQTSLIDWFLKFGSLSNDSEATDLANVLKKVPILEEKSWDWKSLLEPFKELVPAKFVLGLFDKLGFGTNEGSVEWCARAALQKIPSWTDLIEFIDAALTSETAAGFWSLLKESGLSEVLPESCTAQLLGSRLEGLFDKLGFGTNKGSVEWCARAALQKIPSSTDLIEFIDAALTSETAAGFWSLLKESGLSEVLPESCTAQQLASDLEVKGAWRDALIKALQIPFPDLIECALTRGEGWPARCLEENGLLGGLPENLPAEIVSFVGFNDSAVGDELLKALSSKDRGSAWDNAVAFLSDPDTLLAVGGLIADYFGFTNTAKEKFIQVAENMPPHCSRSRLIKQALPEEYHDGGEDGVVCVGHSRGAWLLTGYSHDYNFCDWVVLLGCPGQMNDATENARVIDVFNKEDPVIKLRDDNVVNAEETVECTNMDSNHIATKYAECIRQKSYVRTPLP